jgi:hypothetical protein
VATFRPQSWKSYEYQIMANLRITSSFMPGTAADANDLACEEVCDMAYTSYCSTISTASTYSTMNIYEKKPVTRRVDVAICRPELDERYEFERGARGKVCGGAKPESPCWFLPSLSLLLRSPIAGAPRWRL